ncbi:glycoside hydrolase family 13 protein [Gluconobacter japonicus]|uniref:glycoside hydrolase family 13 protein n=1 Tax=Gluconobacter japonicus TaxID=376620 RepID=UPI0039E9F8D8
MLSKMRRRTTLKFIPLLLSGGAGLSMINSVEAQGKSQHTWWKEAIVYQVFIRSFADSNGDGIGDFRGLLNRLDYLENLGVTVLWLNPHYDSPNVDSGYDIRDYRKVNSDFGTMEDFEALMAGAHARDMKVIVDLVVNHTSDQHIWFQKSRSSRDNPYRDYYIWRDGKNGGLPNNYPSFFGGKAWQNDSKTGQYYLHYYERCQPDLNWDNPKVRQEVHDIMRFWIARGVSGFRMDVIPFISKPAGLRDLTIEELQDPSVVFANGPHLHTYLHEMNQKVLSPHNAMSVGEAFGVSYAQTPLFVSQQRKELDMIFHFDTARVGRKDWETRPWTLQELKETITEDDRSTGPDGWTTSFLENHDNPRAVSRFGDNSPASAKALSLLVMGRRGTVFIFQGQEIGMTNISFDKIEDFEDVNAKGIWADTVGRGTHSANAVLTELRQTSRDNARTPMQWNNTTTGGFTTGTPWFRLNPNTDRINVAAQELDSSSVLAFYRQIISFRKSHPVLVYGTFQDIDPQNPNIFAFTRTLDNNQILIFINLTAQSQAWALPAEINLGKILLNTHMVKPMGRTLSLAPWQGCITAISS